MIKYLFAIFFSVFAMQAATPLPAIQQDTNGYIHSVYTAKWTNINTISATARLDGVVTGLGTITGRRLEERVTENVISITDFGAVGGTNDETLSLQYAINAASTNKVGAVFIPGQTYLINSVVFTNTNVRIFGQSTNAVLKHRMSPVPTGPMLKYVGNFSRSPLISDITLDGNKQGSYASNSAVHAEAILVQITTPSTSQRIVFDGVTFQNQIADSIEIFGTPVQTIIRNCIFKDGWEYADDADVANNPDARNSEYVNFDPQGSSASPIFIVENSYFGSTNTPASTTHFPVGIVVAGSLAHSTYPTGLILGNKFENIPGWNLYAHTKGFRIMSNTHTNNTRYLGRINTGEGTVVAFNTATGIRSDATEMYLFDAVEHGVGEEGNTALFYGNDIIGSGLTTVPAIRVGRGGNGVQIINNTITNVAKAIHYNGGGSADAGSVFKVKNNTIYSTVTPSDSTGTIHIENSSADIFVEGNTVYTSTGHGIYCLGLVTNAQLFVGADNFVSTPTAGRGAVLSGLKYLSFAGKYLNTGGSFGYSLGSTAVITNLYMGKIELLGSTLPAVTWSNVGSASGELFYSGAPTMAAPNGTLYRRTDAAPHLYLRVAGAWTDVISTVSLTPSLNAKVDESSGFATNLTVSGVQHIGALNHSLLTASRALVTDANKNITNSTVTSTELGYLSGVTSALQTQLNNKQPISSELTDIDTTAPGILKYYGTDGSGLKGFFPLTNTFQYTALALTNMTSDLATGNGYAYYIFPVNGTVRRVWGNLFDPSSSGNVTLDVNLAGSTIMAANKITIEATEYWSGDAATQPVITSSNFNAGQVFTVDIDAAGTDAKGGQVVIEWYPR